MAKQSLEEYVERDRQARESFLALSRREELLSRSNPGLYGWRVRWFAYLGYAYLAGVILFLVLMAVLLGLILATGHFSLGAVSVFGFILAMLGMIFKALW